MGQSIKKMDVDVLEAEENVHQPGTCDHQMDILDYVQNVKKALTSLVDQVAEDQEKSSRIVEKTRKELTQQKTVATKQSESLDVQLKTLQAQCDERGRQLEHVQSELIQMTQHFHDEQRKHEEALSKQEDPVDLKNQLHDMQEASKAAKRRIKKLEKSLNEQSADVESAQNLQQELKQRTLELTEQAELLSVAQHAADAFKDELNPLTQELDEAREQLAALEDNKTATLQARETEHQELIDVRTHIETLEGELQEQTHKVDTLTQKLNEAQASIAPIQSKLDSVVASETSIKQELRDLHKHITKLNYSLDEEKKARAEAEQSRDAVQTEAHVQDAQNKSRSYQKRIKALETTEQASADTILKLKAELKKAAKYNTEGRARLEELRKRAKATLDTDQQKDERIQFLEDKFSANQDNKNAQQNLHRNLHEQIVTLEKQLKDAVHHNGSLKSQLESNGNSTPPEPHVDLELKIVENNKQLGRLLLKSGVITQVQLDEVLNERKYPDYDRTTRIGQQFIEKGYASEDVVMQAVAHQMKIPFLRIDRKTVKYNALRLVSEQLAEMHQCMPLYIQAGNLMLAMVNPMDLVAIEDIERSSGYPVKVMVSTSEDIKGAFKRYYKKQA